jgi:L-cysteate sulfo-lyase
MRVAAGTSTGDRTARGARRIRIDRVRESRPTGPTIQCALVTPEALRAAIARVPTLPFVAAATPIEPLPRLSAALGGGARLFVKRDDAIPFGFGGNKVRKLSFVAARAQADGADTLITAGGVQSNHARATASAAAKLGLRAVLVANGRAPARPTANALLDALLGAEIEYVGAREDRASKMKEIADRLRAAGRRPFVIPIGASTPLGALGYVQALLELVAQMPPPDVIVHATSSGGTQAGLVAAARLLGLPTRILGISADDPSPAIGSQVRAIVGGIGALLDVDAAALAAGTEIEVDDRFVGDGYGIPTAASREAAGLAARTEALFLDPTYTAKAMAALIALVRQQQFSSGQTVLFWHTGGQVGLFA